MYKGENGRYGTQQRIFVPSRMEWKEWNGVIIYEQVSAANVHQKSEEEA